MIRLYWGMMGLRSIFEEVLISEIANVRISESTNGQIIKLIF